MNTTARDVTKQLTSDDDVYVQYDADIAEDGSTIEIRRTVWKKAHRAKDREILHLETVAELSTEQALNLLRDLGGSLAYANAR